MHLKIFIDADRETQYLLVKGTEVKTRRHSEEQFARNWQRHIYDLEHYIKPSRQNADIVCNVNQSRKFSSDIINHCQCNH